MPLVQALHGGLEGLFKSNWPHVLVECSFSAIKLILITRSDGLVRSQAFDFGGFAQDPTADLRHQGEWVVPGPVPHVLGRRSADYSAVMVARTSSTLSTSVSTTGGLPGR